MKRSVAEIHSINPDQPGVSRTIAESTYRRIRQDILWVRFAPGSPLRSDELRARYGVGISPLREALTRLASERLVTSVGQRGFRVAPLTAYDVEDTMATRILIESGGAVALDPARRHGLGNGLGGRIPRAVALSDRRKNQARRPKTGRCFIASFTWRCWRHAARNGSSSSPSFCSIRRNGSGFCAPNSARKKY